MSWIQFEAHYDNRKHSKPTGSGRQIDSSACPVHAGLSQDLADAGHAADRAWFDRTTGGVLFTAAGCARPRAPRPQGSSLVGDSAQPAPAPEASPTLTQRFSPWLTRVGFTFIVGFVVGWAFRAFIKIMSMIASLALAVVLALSYFGVLNVDFSSAEKQYESAMSWVTDQASRAAKTILNHIPGSASSFAGMFIGFRRK